MEQKAVQEAKLFDRFLHYKGGKYTFIHEAVHTETGERLVIYTDGVAIFARPYDMFFGQVEVDGELVPRFRLISKQ